MCHHVETATKWYVKPKSIKEAFTTRTYLEYGMKGTATEVSGTSKEASGRKVFKNKLLTVSGDRDKAGGDAVGGSYALEVTEKKGLEVLSSDDDDDDDDDDDVDDEAACEVEPEFFAGISGEEELCSSSEVSAGQKVGVSKTEMRKLCMENTSPHTHYLRGPMEKRKTLQNTDEWIL